MYFAQVIFGIPKNACLRNFIQREAHLFCVTKNAKAFVLRQISEILFFRIKRMLAALTAIHAGKFKFSIEAYKGKVAAYFLAQRIDKIRGQRLWVPDGNPHGFGVHSCGCY